MEGERFLRRMEKTRDEQAGIAPVESGGPSLNDVLDQPEFSLYLNSVGGKANLAMWDRYRKGEATAADMVKTVEQHKEYLSRTKSAESLMGVIEDYTADIVKSSAEFRDLSNAKGADNVHRVLKEGLLKMALGKPKEFSKVQAEYQKLKDFEEQVDKPLDKKIKNWCEKNNIPEDEDLRKILLDNSSPLHRRELIHERLKKNMSAGRLFIDMLKMPYGAGSIARASELAQIDVQGTLTNRDALTSGAGMFARDLLIKNKDFREALARIQVDKEPAFKEGAETMMKFKDLQEAKIDENHMNLEFNKYLTKAGKVHAWPTLSKPEQEKEREQFWNGMPATPSNTGWQGYREHLEQHVKPEGRGFWASLFNFLFSKDFYKDPSVVKALE